MAAVRVYKIIVRKGMKAMKALFIVAEMQEAKHIIKHYRMKQRDFSSIDVWSVNDCNLIVTGPGVNNVISALSKATLFGILSPFADVINVGYAGAKGLAIGSVVNVSNCHCLEFPTKADTKVENCVKLSDEGYDCYTSFDFVEKDNGIVGSALFDMELAYIARFGYKSLSSIKIVSDNLYYEGFKEFDDEKAWKKAIKEIEKEIKRRRETDVPGYITT